MVKFLLFRPIALSMVYIALAVLGTLAVQRMPVALMPDIDIPKVTVKISEPNLSAVELENTVVKPLRRSFLQLAHLDDITTEVQDGLGTIHIKFEYNTEIDFAFIEVNEKIDRTMNRLPNEVNRPVVIKASATDIPVLSLDLTLQVENQNDNASKSELFPVSQDFMDLSAFASNVIKKRIEQLDEVAMVDISGQVFSELLIIPDLNKLNALGISLEKLRQSILNKEIALGNLLIKDAQYQYNIRFENSLNDKQDIENIYLKIDGKLLQIKELATVVAHPKKRMGLATSQGKDAITMSIIQQSDVQIKDLKQRLNDLITHFKQDYPNIEFRVLKDQTQLLEYTIDNLQQSLVLGAFLAFVVMFFFLKDFKSPFLIGLSIPASLIISVFVFQLIGLSINIISLSGLILGIGMMIDNSIIVIDNIVQYHERRVSLVEACVKGTNEVFRPMLSSVLTTCVVFIPLIFINGIAGAMFYDQAISITVGLIVSLLVSVTLLPVYFHLFYKEKEARLWRKIDALFHYLTGLKNKGLNLKLPFFGYEQLYERGFKIVMRHQIAVVVIFTLMLGGGWILFQSLPKEKMPAFLQDEILLYLDWNERIHIDENKLRSDQLTQRIKVELKDYAALIGQQQFVLHQSQSLNLASESLIYLQVKNPNDIHRIKKMVGMFLQEKYPMAKFKFSEATNIFNTIFSDNEYPLTARLRPVGDILENPTQLQEILTGLQDKLGEYSFQPFSWQEVIELQIDSEKLLLYQVSQEELYHNIKTLFNENELMVITSNQSFISVTLGGMPQQFYKALAGAFVKNGEGVLIPIQYLIREKNSLSMKHLVAGQEGAYVPLNFKDYEDDSYDEIIHILKNEIADNKDFEVSFSGGIFSSKQVLNQLLLILGISLLLLYFILAAQFESLTLPFIILIEVPIDIFGSFLMLYIFDATINLMSMIGIVVMSGIIINDSILKIDTVNQLRKQGYPLMKALMVAGKRRLKPILMTSITTVLALVGFLLGEGMGVDLQKPLALAVIGGMTIGTIVSLYFIPICYYHLKK